MISLNKLSDLITCLNLLIFSFLLGAIYFVKMSEKRVSFVLSSEIKWHCKSWSLKLTKLTYSDPHIKALIVKFYGIRIHLIIISMLFNLIRETVEILLGSRGVDLALKYTRNWIYLNHIGSWEYSMRVVFQRGCDVSVFLIGWGVALYPTPNSPMLNDHPTIIFVFLSILQSRFSSVLISSLLQLTGTFHLLTTKSHVLWRTSPFFNKQKFAFVFWFKLPLKNLTL